MYKQTYYFCFKAEIVEEEEKEEERNSKAESDVESDKVCLYYL